VVILQSAFRIKELGHLIKTIFWLESLATELISFTLFGLTDIKNDYYGSLGNLPMVESLKIVL
jgi:hypothetical protein